VDATAKELEEARKEAAKYRTERKELAAKLAEYEALKKAEDEAKLSEQEKAQKRSEELAKKLSEYEAKMVAVEARSRALALENAVIAAAPKAGIAHPGAAVKLLDPTTLELNDDGTPKNLDDVLKGLLKEYPFLGAGPVITATNPSRSESQAGATEAAREAYIRAKVFGQPDSMFNVKRARAEGGGVVIRDEK
jgi:membrane protein involved in colicin uptake